ncbi:hypothetical protein [Streptomyces sp. NPDC059224]|uniref:hypothetical protein n=1 Tax=Streptomyces sp. NPDC059224 TaxID=3346775 RepID=UPI0036A54EF7
MRETSHVRRTAGPKMVPRARGAVAYPVNALAMTPADWREHYGGQWDALVRARAVHDPHGILGRGHGMVP